MANARFDLIVIGSGPAGRHGALAAAKLGKRVALIDRRSMVGGVCIHTGTIPSKAIREAVLHLTAFNQRDVYGANYAVKHNITMADLLAKANHVIRSETEVIHAQMRRAGVTTYFGDASFVSPNAIHLKSTEQELELTGHNILLAVGTEPARPSNLPFTPGKVIDSNELIQLKDLPRSIIIVGGGVIGTEYAAMLAAVGVQVTLVDARPRLMEFVDDEIAENLQFRLREMGIRLKLGEALASVEPGAANEDVTAIMESGKTLRAQTLLYAIGRQGATHSLGLENANLQADNRGRLTVNEHYQTTVPNVYAAGDVIGFPALAATSMEQGRLAAMYMFKQLAEEAAKVFPYGIYTIPEISMIGQTEQQLTKSKTPYEVGIARYREIARGQLIGDPHGILKLLFHPHSRRLLGVHAIGTGATEIIHIGQAVMSANMPIDYFVDTVFNYPTLAECYKVAAMDGLARVSSGTTIDFTDMPEPIVEIDQDKQAA
jgi:NAD(P) transhydrogenase